MALLYETSLRVRVYEDQVSERLRIFMITINLIIALPAEAKPLIKHFRLQQDLRVRPFALYHNKAHSIHLIVSGVGRVASAAAVAYLYSYSSSYQQESVFINLGIAGAAGSAEEDLSEYNKLGSVLLANRIISTSSNQFYYPCVQIIKKYLPEIQSAPCICVDQPDNSYDYFKSEYSKHNYLIDMESAGFFHAARIFVSQEQIFVLKIISDRNFEEQKLINSNTVIQWIQSAIPMLNRLIEFCDQTIGPEISSAISSAPSYLDNTYFNQIHFTAHQRHECNNLWRRLQLLGYTVDQIMGLLEKNQEASQKLSASYILKNLKQLIDQKKLRFSSEFMASC